MEQWKMHRLGFRNFWLYDKEDFVIEDGHLLLRGSNASGKSITTQSFIPFILDGNRSPGCVFDHWHRPASAKRKEHGFLGVLPLRRPTDRP